MKNFKRILAAILCVLLVVPAMAFTASADDYNMATYWTPAARNQVSNLNAGWAAYNDQAYFAADAATGKLSALDMSITLGGAFCYFPLNKVTSTMPDELNGFSVTLNPRGYDVDGDSALEYASSFSFIWTNKPENYNTAANHPATSTLVGADELSGHMYGLSAPAAGEFTLNVILLDMVQVSWYQWPGQVADDGIANYYVFRVASNGNYWGDSAKQLTNAVDFSSPISVALVNEYSEDDEAYLLGVTFNGTTEYLTGYGSAFDGISNNADDGSNGVMFNFGVAAYGFGTNMHNASFELTEICGSSDVAHYTGAYCLNCTWGEWSEATTATCTEASTHTRTCTVCGRVQTEEVAPALGHTWSEWTTTLEPTCTAKGSHTRTCTVCGETEVEAIAKLGHDYGAAYDEVAATCTEAGSYKQTCSRCDKVRTVNVAALGHDYSVANYITLPTHETAGSARYTCSRCGDIGPTNEVAYDLGIYWVGAGRNVVSTINSAYAPYDNNYFVSGDAATGKVSALDMSIAYGGAFCYFPVTKVTSQFATTLGGFTATINPRGYDVDGDSALEYASSFSFIWTNKPEQYNTAASHPETSATQGADELYGHLYGKTAFQPGEFTFVAILLDYLQVSWYQWPEQAAVDDGISEYFVYRVVSNGNYWGDKAVKLTTAVNFANPIQIGVVNEYSEDDEAYLLGVTFNGVTEYCTGFGGAYDGLSNNADDGTTGAMFNFGVAAYGFGTNVHNASFEITNICGSTAVDTFAGAGVAVTAPTVTANKGSVVVTNGQYVNDLFVISGTDCTTYAQIKAARDTADFYLRATSANFNNLTWSCLVPNDGEYTVLVRTVDGAEHVSVVSAVCDTATATATDLNVTFAATDAVKIVRYAPGTGLNTVAAIRAAAGSSYINGSKFADNQATIAFPAGTYSYVVELVNGTLVFGEFTTAAHVYDVPTINGTAISGITADVASIRYAAGTFATQADVKAAADSRTVLASYVADGAYAFRAKNHALPLTGAWTFAVNYTDGHVEIVNVAMPVAVVDGVGYSTLADAIAAANGGVVDLVDEVVLTEQLNITTDVTINGNMNTISGKPVAISGAANVTLNGIRFTGAVVEGANKYTGSNNMASALYARGTGDVTITGCLFINSAWDAIQITASAGAYTITDNLFSNTEKGARYLHIEAAVVNTVTLTVTGNIFNNVSANYAADSAITIYRIAFANMFVTNNTYTGEGADALTTTNIWISNGTDDTDLMAPALTKYVVPTITPTGLVNFTAGIKTVRYAAGTYSNEADVKRAEGARVILGSYIVDGAYTFRAKYHAIPLTGEWTFVINYVDGTEEIVNINF